MACAAFAKLSSARKYLINRQSEVKPPDSIIIEIGKHCR
jgi:hypothetical protein